MSLDLHQWIGEAKLKRSKQIHFDYGIKTPTNVQGRMNIKEVHRRITNKGVVYNILYYILYCI